MRVWFLLSMVAFLMRADGAPSLDWKSAAGSEIVEKFFALLGQNPLGPCDRSKPKVETSSQNDVQFGSFRYPCDTGNTAVVHVQASPSMPLHLVGLSLETPLKGIDSVTADNFNISLVEAAQVALQVDCSHIERSSIEEHHFCQSEVNPAIQWVLTVSAPARYARKHATPPLSYSFHATPGKHKPKTPEKKNAP